MEDVAFFYEVADEVLELVVGEACEELLELGCGYGVGGFAGLFCGADGWCEMML